MVQAQTTTAGARIPTPVPRPTIAMKRSRIEENKYDSVWARLVARMLFVILRLTELAPSLMMGERIYMGPFTDRNRCS